MFTRRVTVLPFESSARGSHPFYSVSCPRKTFCVAVGATTAFIWGAGKWSSTGDIGFSSVSCPTASFCVAANWSGKTITRSGGGAGRSRRSSTRTVSLPSRVRQLGLHGSGLEWERAHFARRLPCDRVTLASENLDAQRGRYPRW